MPTFFIIIILIFFVMSSIAKKNAQKQKSTREAQQNAQRAKYEAQKAEEKRRMEEMASRLKRPEMKPSVAPRVGAGTWHCVCGADNGANAAFCTNCGRRREEAMSGSLAYNSGEGSGTNGSLGGTSAEGQGGSEGEPKHAPHSTLHHVVQPVTESRHAHTEASITNDEELCTEEYEEDLHSDAYTISTGEHSSAYGLDATDRDAVIRGLVYSEILNKPKALRGR